MEILEIKRKSILDIKDTFIKDLLTNNIDNIIEQVTNNKDCNNIYPDGHGIDFTYKTYYYSITFKDSKVSRVVMSKRK